MTKVLKNRFLISIRDRVAPILSWALLPSGLGCDACVASTRLLIDSDCLLLSGGLEGIYSWRRGRLRFLFVRAPLNSIMKHSWAL